MRLSNDDNNAYLRDTARCKYECVRDRNNYFDRCGRRIHGTRTCFIFFFISPPGEQGFGSSSGGYDDDAAILCA